MMPNCMLHILGLGQFRQMGSSNVPKREPICLPSCPLHVTFLHIFMWYWIDVEELSRNGCSECSVQYWRYSTGYTPQHLCNRVPLLLSGSFYAFLVPEIHETLVTLEISL